MKKVYKFYKSRNCVPCQVMNNILINNKLPPEIEIVPVDVLAEDGLNLAKLNGVSSVPTLLREDGEKLIGMHHVSKILEFIGG